MATDASGPTGSSSPTEQWTQRAALAPEYVIVVDAGLLLRFVSQVQPGATWSPGESCLTHVEPAYHDAIRQIVADTLETGLPHPTETSAVGPNGENSYYSVWACPTTFDGERCVSIISTDISHLRRMEEKLAVSDETLRSVISNAEDYITVVNPEHHIVFMNRVRGFESVNQVLGRPVESFLPENERQKVYSEIESVLRTGEPTEYSLQMTIGLDGEARDVHLSTRASPVYRDGDVIGVTLIANDITESVRARKQLRHAEEALQRSQRLKALGELTGGIAHDFNNLLMVLRGSLQLAAMDVASPDAVLQYLDEAESAISQAAELTHRLLTIGRRQTLSPQSLDVEELLSSMAALMARTLGPQLDIRVRTSADAWPCYVDRPQLENAVLNLGLNARDAMGARGGALSLVVSNLSHDGHGDPELSNLEPGDYVCIAVQDRGPGMSSETLERIFEPFFTTKAAGDGSGLGLSMVYGFARQSGGDVAVVSELGRGTTVRIYLPRAVGDPAMAASPRAPRTRQPGQGKHILLVEDMPAVARLTQRLCTRMGYRVTMVHDGEGALVELAKQEDVDLLLTDIGLPGGLDGVALAKAARTRYPDIPVLFMTGFDNGLLDDKTDQNLLRKPFGARQLADALHELLDV